jgi:hypothetical protein
MRVLTAAMVLLMSSALVPSFAEEQAKSPSQPQMTPVQPERSPQQSEQSRGQDQKAAEDVQVGRDWKAQGAPHAPGQPDTKSNQTTTGTSSGQPGKAGGVSVGEQEKKPVTGPATSEPDAKGTRER